MQIGPLDIQVFRLVGKEEVGGKGIHHNTYRGHPGNGPTVERSGIAQLVDTLVEYHGHGNEKDSRIEQRHQYGTLLVTIGVLQRGFRQRKPQREKRQYQAYHITQVVPGIGKQSQ